MADKQEPKLTIQQLESYSDYALAEYIAQEAKGLLYYMPAVKRWYAYDHLDEKWYEQNTRFIEGWLQKSAMELLKYEPPSKERDAMIKKQEKNYVGQWVKYLRAKLSHNLPEERHVCIYETLHGIRKGYIYHPLGKPANKALIEHFTSDHPRNQRRTVQFAPPN